MTVWFTSDLHIGHERVAKIRGFNSAQDHDTEILSNLRDAVQADDVLYVLGDLSGGSSQATRIALGLIGSLVPGRKRLIAGNHDPIHPMNRNAHKWFPEFMNVFESVAPFARVSLSGRRVLLSHFPYHVDREEPRYTQYRLRDEGMPLLHGHLHSEESRTSWHEIHIGVDAWDLSPVADYTVKAALSHLEEDHASQAA